MLQDALVQLGASPPRRMATAPTVLQLLLASGDAGALHAVLCALPSPADAAALRCTCRALDAAASAPSLWSAFCVSDWAEKAFVAPAARALLAAGRPCAAFALARADASRTTLTEDELCTLPWRFRFKAEAGEGWQQLDPFWRGALPTRVAFSRDRRVHRTADPAGPDVGPTLPADVPIAWRWALQGAGRAGPRGSFVRCRVADRSVPTYVVSRHAPNWGWVMESCWALYTAFPMPRPGEAGGALDDGAPGRIGVDAQQREAYAYNEGLPLDEDDFCEEVGPLPAQMLGHPALMDEARCVRPCSRHTQYPDSCEPRKSAARRRCVRRRTRRSWWRACGAHQLAASLPFHAGSSPT